MTHWLIGTEPNGTVLPFAFVGGHTNLLQLNRFGNLWVGDDPSDGAGNFRAASGTYLRVHCRASRSSILRNNIEPRRPVRQLAEGKLHPCGTWMPASFTGLGSLRGPFFPSNGCEPLSITARACRVW
jgi:hypothetical protein